MKLPRDLSGAELAKALSGIGYRITLALLVSAAFDGGCDALRWVATPSLPYARD